MCGICGIVHRDTDSPVSEAVLLHMRDTLRHRGPDDAGHYVAPGIGLAACRLAILDLSPRGHMPMATADGRYQIIYNGEVYNYRELRAELVARGSAFQSQTDTEVILNLYAALGPAMLDRLNGMFAMAIWDTRDRTLFLCRDRLGVKPLYYALEGDTLLFASEEKALFATGVPKRFDPDTWEELLCFRYTAGARTPFIGVQRLLPGHYMLWKDGRAHIRRWWDLATHARTQRDEMLVDPPRWFRTTFDDAVDLRRISDVPVGVLLSGGLDSASVAASLAAQAGSGVASFTVRFPDPQFDEGAVARAVAERWRLENHELLVPPGELLERLSQTSWFNDEPIAHASDPHLLSISRYAKPRVTVLLSGEGADELLGGYVRYRPLRFPYLLRAATPAARWLRWGFRSHGRLAKLGRLLALGSLDRFVLFNACDLLPHDLRVLGMVPTGRFEFREAVLRSAQELYPAEPVRQAMYNDQHTFLCSLLDRNDRTTMAASIECRTPFLDYRLAERLAAMPSIALRDGGSWGRKPLLRRAMADRLPMAVRRHRKWGFGVPWPKYLREVPALRDIVASLPTLDPIRHGPFDRAALTRVTERFLKGDARFDPHVSRLTMIAVWYQTCFGRPHDPI
ncbi:MAG TPA: asparagine synthase (glutamine-hydrolyzing) [Gemmatimonadales bacterium]|nr:asparagine synthase (glutamine-hydrolyzing) [Gemmatimonadales bacterium]